MKKVLFIATVSGHIKMFHTPYLDLFKKNQWKVYVAAKWNGDDKSIISKYCDVMIDLPISRSPLSVSNIKSISILKKICEKEKFDIIHCHTPMGSVVARLAAQKARKKNHTRVIYTAHGFHFYKGAPLKNWIIYFSIEKFLSKYTDTLIAINKEDYDFAKKRFSKRCKDIQYVPGVGINTEKFDIILSDKEKLKLRQSLGLKKDDYIIACVARLDKNKNQGFLIECMNELIKKRKNIHLLFVGDDELNGTYQKMVKDYQLENNVSFLGRRNDIPQLLKITNVVVSASQREGLGLSLIEAISSNVPVVATHNRGHDEIIQKGVNGYYFNNKSEFVEIISKMIDDSDMFCRYSKDSIKKFMLNNVIKEYKKIYRIKDK